MCSTPFLSDRHFLFFAFEPCEHGPQFWNTKICTRLTISEMLFFRLTHLRFFMVRKLVSWCENCAPRDFSWCENWCHGAKIAHPGAAPRCCTQVPLHPGAAPRYCTQVLHPPRYCTHRYCTHRYCTQVLHPGTAPGTFFERPVRKNTDREVLNFGTQKFAHVSRFLKCCFSV